MGAHLMQCPLPDLFQETSTVCVLACLRQACCCLLMLQYPSAEYSCMQGLNMSGAKCLQPKPFTEDMHASSSQHVMVVAESISLTDLLLH